MAQRVSAQRYSRIKNAIFRENAEFQSAFLKLERNSVLSHNIGFKWWIESVTISVLLAKLKPATVDDFPVQLIYGGLTIFFKTVSAKARADKT